MFNSLCISNYEDNDTNADLILNNILEELYSDTFNYSSINENNDQILIKEQFINFSLNVMNNINISTLDQCENILKNKYNIPNDESIYLLTISIKKDEISEDIIIYEIFHPSLKKLDINLCENISQTPISSCSEYSIKSILQNSCLKCKDGFYPLNDEELELKKCMKCYYTCKTCYNEGNEENHNCFECNSFYNYIYNSNCYEYCPDSIYNETNKKFYCNSKPLCPNINLKYLPSNNKCITDCKIDKIFKYEWNHTCYKECPEETRISQEEEYKCELKCPKELPYEYIPNKECIENCEIKDRLNNICVSNYINESEPMKLQEELLIDIQNFINNDINISFIEQGEDIIIKDKEVIFSITSTKNQEKKKIITMFQL